MDGRTRQAIITALANGEPISRIARRLHVGHNTITAIQQIEWAEVSKRKELVLARAARLAAAGFDKLNEEMDAGNIKGALLVPVTGMAIDKVIALSGNATAHPMNLNLNIQPVDIAAQFEKLHTAIQEKAAKVKQARTEEEASTTRHQLASRLLIRGLRPVSKRSNKTLKSEPVSRSLSTVSRFFAAKARNSV